MLGLRVDRIDFLRRRIHVEEQLQRGNLAPLKTKASRRVVPIDDGLVTVLSEHVRRYRRGQDDLLILNRSGRPVGRSTFGECWRRAVEAAGAPSGTRFHQLRSFYASTLIAAGLHPKAIQARLGHAKISETMDTYGALFPNAENLGRGAVDAALGLGPRGIDVASDA